MKKTIWSLSFALLAATLLIFIACNKEASVSDSSTNPNNIPPEQTVNASLQGRVLDENGLPVQGAAVTSGKVTTTTDVNGVFSFRNITMSSRFGYVKVVQPGYFTGSRSIITNTGSSNFVTIQLIPRTSKGSFPAASGGSIPVQTGDSVVFPAAAVVNAATNAAYTGNVNIYATYLDPTASDVHKYMPGDLRGIGTDGKETALQSFGMMVVELQGDAGEKLQIAPGKKAIITMTIPAAQQATAPATIPLWYFNDSSGRWIQEGSAIRQGNTYVGQVGHFSFWNCDAPAGTVNFKVRLKDQHGNPLAYTLVQITSQTWWGSSFGYTDSTGFVQGLIPAGQTLFMQVMSQCGNMLAGANVGPALNDQDLGIIIVTVSFADLTLSGTVVDCSLNPIDSGFVLAHIDGLNYRAAVVKGAFTLPISRCSDAPTTIQLTPGDFKTVQQGSPVSVNVSSGAVNAGQLTACGTTIDQFIRFTLAGNSYNLIAPPDNVSYSTFNGFTLLQASTVGTVNPSINLQFANITGTTGTAFDSTYITTTHDFYEGVYLNCTITSFGPVNGFIEGNFSGPVHTFSGPEVTVSGSFKVRRTN